VEGKSRRLLFFRGLDSRIARLYCCSVGSMPPFLPILPSPGTLVVSQLSKDSQAMLLNRDYVTYMASEIVKKLVEDAQVEIKEKDTEPVTVRVRARMMEEITVEDKVNEEARNILVQYQDEMRRTGVSYQDMFKKVKGQIARDRKLILR
jgi:hypothetical protein